MTFLKKKKTAIEDQLFQDTKNLATPNGRVGQTGHEQAKKYLIQRLEEIGLTHFSKSSYELPYTAELVETRQSHQFTNLVGVIPGK